MRRESPRLLPKASAKRRAVCGRLLLVVVEVVLFFDNAFGSFDLVVGNILVRCHYEIVIGLGDRLRDIVAPLALGLGGLRSGVGPLDVLLIRAALRADGSGSAEVVELRAAAVAFVFGTQVGHAFSSSLGRVSPASERT